MALVTCPECGKEYSNLAPACPNCGCPTRLLKESTSTRPEVRHNSYSSIVNITEVDGVIKKVYKRLPGASRISTVILIALISLALILFAVPGNTIAYYECLLSGELAVRIFFIAWIIVSLVGMLEVKRWGLLSYGICEFTNLLISVIMFQHWSLSWSMIIYHLCFVAVYLSSFLVSESGHNAFEILINNGVIKESKNSNLDETKE